MLVNRVGGGSENLKVELTEQESLITQIQEILPFKGGLLGIQPEMFGCTKMAVDVFKYNSDTAVGYLEHSLNERPKYAFVMPKSTVKYTSANQRMVKIFGMTGNSGDYMYYCYEYFTISGTLVAGDASTQNSDFTNRIPVTNSIRFAGGVEYELITMA